MNFVRIILFKYINSSLSPYLRDQIDGNNRCEVPAVRPSRFCYFEINPEYSTEESLMRCEN